MGKRAAVRSASTPCQLRVTSFASKSRLVDRHPLYVPASAAPHVRASHYGLRLAHCSEQYDHGPKITTTDWQTRSAGDEEVTNLEARGFDGWDHRRRRALVCGCVVERSLSGQRFPATGIARAKIRCVNGHHFRAGAALPCRARRHHADEPPHASCASKVTASSAISMRGNRPHTPGHCGIAANLNGFRPDMWGPNCVWRA